MKEYYEIFRDPKHIVAKQIILLLMFAAEELGAIDRATTPTEEVRQQEEYVEELAVFLYRIYEELYERS